MATNPYTSTRICKDCGKVMTNVSNIKLYCPECAKKRHDEQMAAWWAKKNAEIRTPYQRKESPEARIRNAEKRDAEFRADFRAADAAGLSYGKYMLLKASKKPAGAATPTSRKK
nr:MAG TPA: hypothetical protein [Caudoviricetes sp.]